MSRLSLGLSLGPRSGGGTPTPSPIAYTLLHNFEAVGTATGTNVALSLHTGDRKVLGSGALRVVGNGGGGSQAVNSIVNTTLDLSQFDRIAYCVDLGDGSLLNQISQLRPRFISSAVQYTPMVDTGLSAPTDVLPAHTGKVWISFALANIKVTNFAGASIQSVGAASKTFQFNITSPGNFAEDIVIDAAVVYTGQKGALCITGDDNVASHYTHLYSRMAPLNLPLTLFTPSNYVNSSGMTQAQVAEILAAGGAVCPDSGPNSESITMQDTVALGVAQVNTCRDALLTMFGDTEGAKYLCYGNGAFGYPMAPQSLACTGDGTDIVTVPAASAATAPLCKGHKVFEGGLLVNEVLRATATNKVQMATPVTAGAHTFVFAANEQNVAVTTNGTTTVTMASVANKFPGQHFEGAGAAAGTTVLSVNTGANSVELSAAPPLSGAYRANFLHKDGEWYHKKVIAALRAAGYVFGRTTQSGGMADPFGAIVDNTLVFPGYGMSGTDAAAQLRFIDQYTGDGRNVVIYFHGVSDGTYLDTFLAGIATRRDAGMQVLTVPQLGDRMFNRAPIA